MKLSKFKLFILSLLVVFAALVGGIKLFADTGSNSSGYAWSSNIGWIKLNDCANLADPSTCNTSASYGVSILPVAPGTISGYAWSSNIGWITFNSSGCPTNGCTPGAYATWNTDGSATIKGWARACSVYVSGCSGALKDPASLGSCSGTDWNNHGGYDTGDTNNSCEWDGYIALDSVTGGGSGGIWGLSIGTNKSIGGYAWGSQVIGWIGNISASILNGPAALLTANPTAIESGSSSTLTVTAANIDDANSCTLSGSPSGIIPTLTMTQGQNSRWTGTVSVSPTITTTYTVNCTKGSQTATAQATLTVDYFTHPKCTTNCTPPPGCPTTGCTPTGCTSDCTGGPGNPNGELGGYCAITNPSFSWDSDATSCTITKQGGGSVTVGPSSQASGGTLGGDGRYYYTANLPVTGSSSTYTLQCDDASTPVTLQLTIPACQRDFLLTVTPTKQDFVINGATATATYTVSAVPQFGFTDPINLSIQSWPSNMPSSKSASFDNATLSWSGSAYTSAQMTISVATIALTSGTNYTPIIVQGVSGSFTRTASFSAGSTVKIKPVFKEF
jgi:hypothetical protein